MQQAPQSSTIASKFPLHGDAYGRRPLSTPDMVAGILAAFAAHGGESRLVITSRYDFTARGQTQDDAASLARIQLAAFAQQDHERYLGRLQQVWEPPPQSLTAGQRNLLRQTVPLASGNPGLLRTLTDFVRTDEAGAPALLQEVKAYLDEGRQPTDCRVGDYLQRLAIDCMLDRLRSVENMLLSLSKDKDLPVPVAVMQSIAEACLGAGVGGARLLGVVTEVRSCWSWHGHCSSAGHHDAR